MNVKTQTELQPQLVDLGDAKEQTKGLPYPEHSEENPIAMTRR